MANGYTRQSAANIQTGLVILAAPLNNEFNALQSAFDSSTGHAHDGSTGQAPKISLTTSISGVLPIINGGTNATTAATARTNLGLGTSAVQDIGTSGATVPLLNGTNTWASAQTFSTPVSVASGGTGVTTSTGSGSNVLSTSPTLVTPILGTPASGTLTNATGLPISTGVSGLGTGVATFLATPTSANLITAVTDETGTGSLVFANSPTLVTPTVGVATATSINKVSITAPATSATLTIANGTTLTTTSSTSVGQGQYLGTSTNDNATAGSIGEYIQSEITSGSAVSMTTGTPTNVTSISLTAGDWDVTGLVAFTIASGTTVSSLNGVIHTVSATIPTAPNGGAYVLINTNFANGPTGDLLPIGTKRLSLSTTTTVYLIAQGTFAVSALSVYGGIYARRMR